MGLILAMGKARWSKPCDFFYPFSTPPPFSQLSSLCTILLYSPLSGGGKEWAELVLVWGGQGRLQLVRDGRWLGRVWVTYSRRGRKYWSSETALLITSFQFSCRERQTQREEGERLGKGREDRVRDRGGRERKNRGRELLLPQYMHVSMFHQKSCSYNAVYSALPKLQS